MSNVTKPKTKLVLDLKKAQSEKKYVGDPGSPNHIPDSPLIDRPTLSMQQIAELKRICSAVLASVKSSDDGTSYPFPCFCNRTAQDDTPVTHDRHSSFAFLAAKQVPHAPTPGPVSSRRTASGRERCLRKGFDQDESVDVCERRHPAHTRARKTDTKPSFNGPGDEALWDIRDKLDSRPKTSAAACIDYAGDETAPSSVPSNRTTGITYSTPFTSAGITPEDTSKPFSQAPVVAEAVAPILPSPEPHEPLSIDRESAALTRAWMAEQFDIRRTRLEEVSQVEQVSRSMTESQLLPQSRNTGSRPVSRAGTIKNSIKEYIRPGSVAGSVRGSIHTTHSMRSTSSSRPRSRGRWSTLKTKISKASLRSRSGSRRQLGYNDGDEYFIDPNHPDLNRPLPALPGLDLYQEKPKHIAELMKSMIPTHLRRNTINVVIDSNGLERAMSEDEEKQREEDLARAVMEKMSMGSIGSVPTSPTGRSFTYDRTTSLGSLNRPATAGSRGVAGTMPPQKYRSTVTQVVTEEVAPAPPSAIPIRVPARPSFVKRWAGKVGLSKRPKPAPMV